MPTITTTSLSSVSCELRIIKAKNIEHKSNESLFVRCYLFAGNNTRIKLNTREISSKSNLFWNQVFSFECLGNKTNELLSRSSVVLELRRRITIPIFGKISRSVLVGRAEVPWKSVFESKEMEIEKWVFMSVNTRWASEDVKPPAIQMAMKLTDVLVTEETSPERKRRLRRATECSYESGCNSCCNSALYSLD